MKRKKNYNEQNKQRSLWWIQKSYGAKFSAVKSVFQKEFMPERSIKIRIKATNGNSNVTVLMLVT
jgi:hypothetical protein